MKKQIAASIAASAIVIAGFGGTSVQAEEIQDIPLRKTIENMEGKITWNEADRSIRLEVGGVEALLALDSEDATVQGQAVKLNKKPYLVDESTHISPETFELIRKEVVAAQNKTGYELAGSFELPDGNAEIVYSTPDGNYLLVTEAALGSVTVLDIEDVNNVSVLKKISLTGVSEQAEVTSVVVTPDGKYALAAVRTGDDVNNANPGFVAVIDLATYEVSTTYEVGIGPDSIAISPDGKTAVIAIEDEEVDPVQDEIDFDKVQRPGSIAVISFADGDVLNGQVTNIPVDLDGVEGGVTYPNDPQPEYVAISPDSAKAAVTLQENNAIAIIDLATKTVSNIFGLGVTQHKADLKDDGIVSFTDDLTSRPEADGIAFTPDGNYLVTANEGDLGKNEFDDGVKSGGRNIMVWDLNGNPVYDSMNLIDRSAALVGLYPDDRSENRGSEVENLTVAEAGGKPIAAVAAERDNAILFFDMSDPVNPVYLGLIPSFGESPEGIHKVSGRDLFVSADEGSGTISFYQAR